jgi:hypothetical protein
MLPRVSMRKPPRRSITQGITWCRGPANVPHEEREYEEAGHGRSGCSLREGAELLRNPHPALHLNALSTYVPDYRGVATLYQGSIPVSFFTAEAQRAQRSL